VERATDAYSFSHLTLQEYLTALYIVEKRLEKELVAQHLVDERWREIFLLVSGIAKSPVSLLFDPMHQQAKSYIRPYVKLQGLVKWAAVNTKAESELYQRAGMIAISESALGRIARGTSKIQYVNEDTTAGSIARAIATYTTYGSSSIIKSVISSAAL